MSIFGGGGGGGSSVQYVPTPAAQTAAQLPQAPAAANPPMFGANQQKTKAGGTASQQFNASVIGALPQQTPRTILGVAG